MRQEVGSDEDSEVAFFVIFVLIRYGASMQVCLTSFALGNFR